MFTEVGSPHHEPHFHAYYQDEVGIFRIDSLELIAGASATRQKRLVQAWGELHREELSVAWQQLQEGRKPVAIEPLR